MSRELHARAKELFLAARARPADHRVDFVREQCAGNEPLLTEVLSLLEFSSEGEEAGGAPVTGGSDPNLEVPNYRLLRQLGEGGMGEIWEADQLSPLRRRVALKVLRRELRSGDLLDRFESERQALAAMVHPNIATVFDAGSTSDGRPFFAMELVEGTPITDYAKAKRLELRRRLELFARVCRGVQHAHDRGIVHRDLKPSNLLVAEIDGRPVPKIIDFGVAKVLDARREGSAPRTAPGDWIGTPEYMSPEQAERVGAPVDGQTDVYALGVVLYELLAGCRPFESDTDGSGFDEIKRRIAERTPTRPSARVLDRGSAARATEFRRAAGEIRGDLDRIALKALAEDRDDRYRTPLELAEDLEHYLAGKPAVAAGVSMPERIRRTLRRHRLAFAVLASVALAAFVWLWSTRRPSAGALPASVADATAELERSLAVLPFVNLSGDEGYGYLADGLAEELLNELARVPGLRVAARTSSFSFKEKPEDIRTIGRALGVGRVVEGSVRREGDSLRIAAQLVDAESGFPIWSRSFDHELADLPSAPPGIAREISGALKLAPGEPGPMPAQPVDPQAHDLYLRGRHLLSEVDPGSLLEAERLLEAAIEADPSFAPAYAARADAQLLLARFGNLPMADARERATGFLQRALELDNQLPDAHASLGFFWLDRKEPAAAEQALRRALELNPNHALAHLWLGYALASSGRPDEASEAFATAAELDPLNLSILRTLALNRTQAGSYEEGMELFRRMLRIDPRSAETYRMMALTARTFGKLDDAVGWALDALESGPEGPINANEVALAYAALGDTDRALRYVDLAAELGAGNLWVPVMKSGVYFRGGLYDQHQAFTEKLRRQRPVPQTGPLTTEERVSLILNGRSAALREEWDEVIRLYERALGDPPTAILEPSFDLPFLVGLAEAYRAAGREEAMQAALDLARKSLAGLEGWLWRRLVVPESVAAIQWMEGDRASAVGTLLAAEEAGWTGWGFRGPLWDDLREEAEVRAMIERIEAKLARMRSTVAHLASDDLKTGS